MIYATKYTLLVGKEGLSENMKYNDEDNPQKAMSSAS